MYSQQSSSNGYSKLANVITLEVLLYAREEIVKRLNTFIFDQFVLHKVSTFHRAVNAATAKQHDSNAQIANSFRKSTVYP